MFKSTKNTKCMVGILLAAAIVLTSLSSFAAGQITWQIKDYVTTLPNSGATGQGGPALQPAYEIVYEQYLDGVPTGLVVSGETARQYGLKPYADKVTRPVTWYDISYPNLQYEEIWADGQYTGLVWPTGAQLPYTAYKDFRFMWEVGGTHKEIAETRAKFGTSGDDAVDYIGGETYPKVYAGTNANVKEENKYFGFDVFEVIGSGAARDVEVVLDKTGNCVNVNNAIKANSMVNAANENTIDGSIAGLVNSGNGVSSVLYAMLNSDAAYTHVAQRSMTDAYGVYHEVPVFDYTGYPANYFDNKLPVTHYFTLSGPVYNAYGNVEAGMEFARKINAYADCVSAVLSRATGPWAYKVNAERYGYYTNNLITTHASAQAVTDWVYAGYELAEPYRMYEFLSIEGVVFDGDIDNDGVLDTPVIFRYPTSGTSNITSPVGGISTSGLFDAAKTSYALADPKVEWRYAFAEASYPHEIIMQKFVQDMNGQMVATDDLRGSGKYAKENLGAEINPSSTGLPVLSGNKNYQMRLEWRENGMLYVSPYYDVNEYAGSYVELSLSPDPSYIAAYDYAQPGSPLVVKPTPFANK